MVLYLTIILTISASGKIGKHRLRPVCLLGEMRKGSGSIDMVGDAVEGEPQGRVMGNAHRESGRAVIFKVGNWEAIFAFVVAKAFGIHETGKFKRGWIPATGCGDDIEGTKQFLRRLDDIIPRDPCLRPTGGKLKSSKG